MDFHVYLAGPTVFYPDARQRYAELKSLCAAFGLKGRSPLDTELSQNIAVEKREIGRQIYHGNVELIRQCHAVIADVSAFRGLEPDSGTCFEIGMAVALGKPVACYSHELRHTLAQRIATTVGINEDQFDLEYGYLVEDFDMPLNLMLASSCHCAHSAQEALAYIAEQFGIGSRKDHPESLCP